MAAISPPICIIEDDESVRRALCRLLRSVGLGAEVFPTAEAFLQSWNQGSRRCLILDVNLPGLSGLELQRQLRAEGWLLPIVFITAYSEDSVREQAFGGGAIAFLPKPFEESALLQAVCSVMNAG